MINKTILITGSNSGLGLEAARLVAEKPEWTTIVLGARTEAKASQARDTIVASTGRSADDFHFLLMDLLEPDSVDAALADAEKQDLRFDALVLNAGGMAAGEGGKLVKAASGQTKVFAMNVGGHARLVSGLLAAGRIEKGATLVFAASEASRGIPMMVKAATLPEGYADIDEMLDAVTTGDHTQKADDMFEYGLVKMIGTAWMADLARSRGDDLRALAVSPGMTAGTNVMAGMPAPMQAVLKWVVPMMKLFGRAHTVESGAGRYVQALEDLSLVNGGFYASPGTGATGALTLQSSEVQPLLVDDAFISGVGRLIHRLAPEGAVLAQS